MPQSKLRAEVVKLAVPAPRTEPIAPSIAKPKKKAKSDKAAQTKEAAVAGPGEPPAEARLLEVEASLSKSSRPRNLVHCLGRNSAGVHTRRNNTQ